MKIALVTPYDYFFPGGVNNHVAHLLQNFRQRGIDARVAAVFPQGTIIPPYALPIKTKIHHFFSGGSVGRVSLDPRVFLQVRRMLKQQRFDIVHLHNPVSPMICLSFLAQRTLVPDTAFVATFHEYRDTPNPSIELAKPLLCRWTARLNARIAVSEAAMEFNQKHLLGTYTIISNGVDTKRFSQPVPASNVPKSAQPTILHVGRVEERKGILHLLEAFHQVRRQLPTARLLIVGPKYMMNDSLRRAIAQRPLDGVEFVGQVSEEALPGFYQRADVFCAASIGFESFGIVLLEAMAAGIPIVASDIPGYRSVLQSGKQGILVPPQNSEALAQALLELLQKPQLRRDMAQAGQQRAQEFDWKHIAERVLALYAEL